MEGRLQLNISTAPSFLFLQHQNLLCSKPFNPFRSCVSSDFYCRSLSICVFASSSPIMFRVTSSVSFKVQWPVAMAMAAFPRLQNDVQFEAETQTLGTNWSIFPWFLFSGGIIDSTLCFSLMIYLFILEVSQIHSYIIITSIDCTCDWVLISQFRISKNIGSIVFNLTLS